MKVNDQARTDRRLRGLVADLADRHADDIEAVWHALSDTERKQLRPLLEDAASLGSGEPGGFASVLSAAPSQAGDQATPGPATPAIGRLAGHWPDALLAQLAGCVDDAQRARLFASHPAWQRHPVSPLAPCARDALLKAAHEAIRALPPAVDIVAASPRPPDSWGRRLLNGLRRGRA
ncbi:hypothetical protein BLA39750_03385 [Burkholderia lata]|uniref:Uncharacterized protein n=1 Tax=Burkholderia lata (strain ATCC 17760 / DSM 23089 / LMG 22485 / NCIMB 9086 / R18194 / 383) TaxID=482957 RepID=A0A6P2XU11_BURL3|nr:hypothetical protein [Burkholderia lata]VWD13402.1 hypothetical protein BLA39750_03385 [Burkholderia lata]